jgi:hypothetical protein
MLSLVQKVSILGLAGEFSALRLWHCQAFQKEQMTILPSRWFSPLLRPSLNCRSKVYRQGFGGNVSCVRSQQKKVSLIEGATSQI